MKKDAYWQKPKKAGDGWWYVNERGIEVHADADHNKLHTTVTISRAKLVEYIKRTAK